MDKTPTTIIMQQPKDCTTEIIAIPQITGELKTYVVIKRGNKQVAINIGDKNWKSLCELFKS